MTDNVNLSSPSGTVGADDVGGVLIQRVKVTWGPDGTANDVDASSGKTLPVTLYDDSGTVITFNSNKTSSFEIADGVAPVALPSDQPWQTGMANKIFAATFSTLTRPADTTAYSAGDSISNNATAGSVTALSATVSDTNDDPVFISEILIKSTDTGLAGKKLRAYLFNSDPTANSGVGAGDNAAFSQKIAGYIGSFVGTLESGFSDGTVGRLLPTFNDSNDTPAGGFVPAFPTSGAKTLYIQFQAVVDFTPSAGETTIIAVAKGWQGRAA